MPPGIWARAISGAGRARASGIDCMRAPCVARERFWMDRPPADHGPFHASVLIPSDFQMEARRHGIEMPGSMIRHGRAAATRNFLASTRNRHARQNLRSAGQSQASRWLSSGSIRRATGGHGPEPYCQRSALEHVMGALRRQRGEPSI